MVSTDGGPLGVGFRHEGLQLFLKELICGLGRRGRGGSALGTAEIRLTSLVSGGGLPAEAIAAIFTLGLGLQTLDGQVDLAVFCADDHDLDLLAFGQMLAKVADIGIGNLRDMYHAGLVIRQGDKRAEIGDGFDFAF